MRWIQINIEVFLAQMVKSMPEMFKKSSNLELLGELLVSFQKLYKYIASIQPISHIQPTKLFVEILFIKGGLSRFDIACFL